MSAKSKWFTSILAIGILFTSSLWGGVKKANSAVDTTINDAPIIESIDPSFVYSGSPNTGVIITGHNFGFEEYNTSVRLRNIDFDYYLHPLVNIQDALSVMIMNTLLINPTTYTVTVITCNSIIPIIPPSPDCEESNPVLFRVVDAIDTYYPIMRNDH